MIPHEHRPKTPKQSFGEYRQRLIHHDQIGFISGMRGCFNTQKSISAIHHVTELREKNPHDHISRGRKNAFDKIHYPFVI